MSSSLPSSNRDRHRPTTTKPKPPAPNPNPTVRARRHDSEEKENPNTAAKKPSLPSRSVSRGRTVTDIGKKVTDPPRFGNRHGVSKAAIDEGKRDTSKRSADESKREDLHANSSLRWSTSSIPTENGRRSNASSSISRIDLRNQSGNPNISARNPDASQKPVKLDSKRTSNTSVNPVSQKSEKFRSNGVSVNPVLKNPQKNQDKQPSNRDLEAVLKNPCRSHDKRPSNHDLDPVLKNPPQSHDKRPSSHHLDPVLESSVDFEDQRISDVEAIVKSRNEKFSDVDFVKLDNECDKNSVLQGCVDFDEKQPSNVSVDSVLHSSVTFDSERFGDADLVSSSQSFDNNNQGSIVARNPILQSSVGFDDKQACIVGRNPVLQSSVDLDDRRAPTGATNSVPHSSLDFDDNRISIVARDTIQQRSVDFDGKRASIVDRNPILQSSVDFDVKRTPIAARHSVIQSSVKVDSELPGVDSVLQNTYKQPSIVGSILKSFEQRVNVAAKQGEIVENNEQVKGLKDSSVEGAEALKRCLEEEQGKVRHENGECSSSDDGSEGLLKGKESTFTRKLREKVAFLESRVNQIALDLIQTKDMLDSNDVDAPEKILSDISVRINGIEKAIALSVKAEGVSSMNGDVPKQDAVDPRHEDDEQISRDLSEGNSSKRSASSGEGFSNSVNAAKLLRCEELEDRLFPHQKLLRKRLSGNSSGLLLQSQNKQMVGAKGDLNRENSPTDEDMIADQFLTALDASASVSLSADLKNNENDAPVSRSREKSATASHSFHQSGEVESTADQASIKEVVMADEEQLECNEGLHSDERYIQQTCLGIIGESRDEPAIPLGQIGRKISTAGWFVSDGDSVLLAHDDGCCSYHDIANSEEKAEYKVPISITSNIWEDCWLIRAAGSDGRSGKYVVAASAGYVLDGGFCSWDFYTKEVTALQIESTNSTPSSSATSTSMPRILGSKTVISENHHWWYRPCGPLMVSSATDQRTIKMYDIRDGELVMNWQTQKNVAAMNFSSPLQWRNRGKVVVAETGAISFWDVNSIDPQSLQTITFQGRKVLSLHVNNKDAECSGGIRQRLSSSETEGNDGVFCTQDAVNVIDFRVPTGVGLKIPIAGETVQSLFARGDSIFGGVVNSKVSSKVPVRCRIQQWSLRKGKLACQYLLPDFNTHMEQARITQVWGSSSSVMAINGNGLAVFDASQEGFLLNEAQDPSKGKGTSEFIGSDDLYYPSFDYSGSRVLIVSRDRPAIWKFLTKP